MNLSTTLSNGQIDDLNNIREAHAALREAIFGALDTFADEEDTGRYEDDILASVADLDIVVSRVLGNVASVLV